MTEKKIKEHIKNLKTSKVWLNLTREEFDINSSHGELRRNCDRALKYLHGGINYLRDLVPEPPQDIVIIDNPKPSWMPLMVCDIVQLPFNVGVDYTWEELEDLIIKLSLAGCDAIRIFATGWNPSIEPFKVMLETGEYSFFKPNPDWYSTLLRFRDLLHKYHMRLYIDLYDNCSHKLDWNPFTTARHDFSHYFYGYTKMIRTNKKDESGNLISVNEVNFMIDYWDNRIMNILNPDVDIVSLGNELASHVENSVSERKIWAEKWGVTRAKNILDRGFSQPIPFSGSKETAQKLLGYISKEEHGDDYGWTYRTSCKQEHGLGLPEHVEERFNPSQRRMYSYSDDGVGTNWWNKIPKEKQGYCEITKNGKKYACSAFQEKFSTRGKLV